MQPLEHKAPSLSFLNKEDEKRPRVGGQAWPQTKTPTPIATMHQHSFSKQFLNEKNPSTQEGRKEEESQGTSEEKVQGEGNCTQPLPSTPMPTSPMNPIPPAVLTPTVATSTATTQMPMVKSAATSIPVTVYNLAQGKFEGIPYPTGRPSGRKPFHPQLQSTQQRLQPEAIPNSPTFQVRKETPWPNTVPASTNLFEARADWPIPPKQTPAVKIEKAEVPPKVAAILHATVLPKPQNNRPVDENCTWGPHCPICKKEERVTDRKASRESTTHKILSTPNL